MRDFRCWSGVVEIGAGIETGALDEGIEAAVAVQAAGLRGEKAGNRCSRLDRFGGLRIGERAGGISRRSARPTLASRPALGTHWELGKRRDEHQGSKQFVIQDQSAGSIRSSAPLRSSVIT
jgi:hypothetical protein